MGYTANFTGNFSLDKALSEDHSKLIEALSNKRHDSELMPSNYCQWVIGVDKKTILWDGREKFYSSDKWIAFIVSILEPLGYIVNGKVSWKGEDKSDVGTIRIKNNKIKIWSNARNQKQGKEVIQNQLPY